MHELALINKTVRVFDSCKTRSQLDVACRFANQAMRQVTMYSFDWWEMNKRFIEARQAALSRI
jgi:hypothetical protein